MVINNSDTELLLNRKEFIFVVMNLKISYMRIKQVD